MNGGEPREQQMRTLHDDPPRLHLALADEKIDEGCLDVARAALARARETILPGSPDADEAAFLAVRLAAASVDLRTATAEVKALVERGDPADPVWNRRLRRIIEGAPPVLPRAMRTALLDLLPPVAVDDGAIPSGSAVNAPRPALPDLPGEDEWSAAVPGEQSIDAGPGDGLPGSAEDVPPVPTVSPFDRARAARAVPSSEPPPEPVDGSSSAVTSGPALPDLPGEDGWGVAPSGELAIAAEPADDEPGSREDLAPVPTVSPYDEARAVSAVPPTEPPAEPLDDIIVLVDETLGASEVASGFSGRVTIGAADADLTDADALRDRLVEEMLSSVSEEEGMLLFETATTFLINHDFETAGLMFEAAMQCPEVRVPALEGVMRSLIGAGRFADAVATGARATRIFARAGDALLGIVYLQGIAAQEVQDAAMARSCFARVAASFHAAHFPDLRDRRAAVG